MEVEVRIQCTAESSFCLALSYLMQEVLAVLWEEIQRENPQKSGRPGDPARLSL